MRKLAVCCLIPLLAGCSTLYQPAGWGGGYEDVRLAEDVFIVAFHGGSDMRPLQADEFALLRGAELTLRSGYEWFVITKRNEYLDVGTFTTPTYTESTGSIEYHGTSAYKSSTSTTYGGQTYRIVRPEVVLTIRCYKEKPEAGEMVFDARFLFSSIKEKYGITREIEGN